MKKFLFILAVLTLLAVPAIAQDAAQPAQDQATPPADQSGSGDTLGQAPADTTTEAPAEEPAAGDAMGSGDAADSGDAAETGEAADTAGAGDTAGQTGEQQAGSENGLPENLVRLSELQDMSLGSGDQNQGNVEDVVLTADGKVSHVIASLQGIEGVDDGRYLVPFSALQASQDQLQVNVSNASDLELLAEGIRPTGIAQDSILLSTLMDYRLINNRQEELDGNIEDVVADRQTGEIQYVAVNLGGALGAGGELAAVPYSEVWYNLTDKTVAVDVAADQLDQVNGFEGDQWPAQADSNWRPESAASGPYQGPSLGSGEAEGAAEEPAAEAGDAMTPAPEAGTDESATGDAGAAAAGDAAATETPEDTMGAGDAATGTTGDTGAATGDTGTMGAGDTATGTTGDAAAGTDTTDSAAGDTATTTTTTVP